MTKDLNKSISNIEYNFLNLPSKVTFTDGSTITYLYGADGTKLRTVHKIGSATTTTNYCDDVIYENGTAKLLLTEEGYVSLSDSKYHYYLKDHQGNNRVVVDQSGNVEETNHYYPFGGIFASTGNVQPYKYNGKEFDSKKGLNWYDYGARMYDPALGRWHVVDPLAEEKQWLSPYNYCSLNPINKFDSDGMLDDWIYDKERKEYVWDGNVTKAAETPTGYEYVGPSLKNVDNHFKDNNPIASFFTSPKFGENKTSWPGEVLPTNNSTDLEMWLESPSGSIGEGIGKIAANIGYSMVNSPYSLFTGQTIGGTSLTSSEKINAFMDFVPGLISGGLIKTGQVVKTTQKGLQGYNQFIKGAQKSGMEFKGLNWQQNAGRAFQMNKANQRSLEYFDKGLRSISIPFTTKKEFEKK